MNFQVLIQMHMVRHLVTPITNHLRQKKIKNPTTLHHPGPNFIAAAVIKRAALRTLSAACVVKRAPRVSLLTLLSSTRSDQVWSLTQLNSVDF